MTTLTNMVFHPYIPAMVNALEQWLCQKASDGWRLEEVHGWMFRFRKCEPYPTKFFCYSGFGASKGISYDFYNSKNQYSRSGSALNKSSAIIYEADIEKLDANFTHLIRLRNKYYQKHYGLLLLFACLYLVLAIGFVQTDYVRAFILFLGVVALVYAFISVLILFRWAHRNTT